jgi:hypothetical protein
MIFADRNILPRRLGSIGADRLGNRPAEPARDAMPWLQPTARVSLLAVDADRQGHII